jgi:hypothetical protein
MLLNGVKAFPSSQPWPVGERMPNSRVVASRTGSRPYVSTDSSFAESIRGQHLAVLPDAAREDLAPLGSTPAQRLYEAIQEIRAVLMCGADTAVRCSALSA